MIRRDLLMYLLFLLEAVVANPEAACSAGVAVSFRFSVNSRRNETRHRIVSVDLERDYRESSTNIEEISLDVTHGLSFCGEEEKLHLGTVAVALEPRQRRADYELFPGLGYYKLHTTGKIWEDARISCISEQAHLMVINSDAEASVVKEFFSRKPKFVGVSAVNYIFGGFHDKFTEGNFITVTGLPLSGTGYTKWDSGQPNGQTTQNFGGVNAEGLLHDIPIEWKLAFACEQEL